VAARAWNLHLPHHDVSLIVCSRATLADIEEFRTRMNWKFYRVSSYRSDFNFYYHRRSRRTTWY
jgi:predicted dithiol-disulfide oxidoreductase (DUF899 family)